MDKAVIGGIDQRRMATDPAGALVAQARAALAETGEAATSSAPAARSAR